VFDAVVLADWRTYGRRTIRAAGREATIAETVVGRMAWPTWWTTYRGVAPRSP
jgi:hypothetical protein